MAKWVCSVCGYVYEGENLSLIHIQTGKYHTWQVHNNGHTAGLVYNEHNRTQNTKSFAVKTQFQIMISSINIQFTVD